MMTQSKGKAKYAGTTLVEVILYLALTTAMLVMLSSTFNTYLKTRTRSQVRDEVTSQGRYIIQELDRALSAGNDIVLPAMGGSGNSIELDIPNTVTNTTISLSSGDLIVNDGTGSQTLNTNKVTITDFTVENYSGVDENKVLSYSVTLSYAEGSALEFQYENTFHSSVSLKINADN